MPEKQWSPRAPQASSFSFFSLVTMREHLSQGQLEGEFQKGSFIAGDRFKEGKESKILYCIRGSQERAVTKHPTLGINDMVCGVGVLSRIVTFLRYPCTFISVLVFVSLKQT